jgi:multiple sugar transport system permease protein
MFYLFISPWLIAFIVFAAAPMIASLLLSFSDWDSLEAPNFIGVANYVKLLTDDPLFWQSLQNTLYYAVVTVPLTLLVALYLASLLCKPIRGARFFRTAVYLPSVVPLVAAAMIFRWLLAPDTGPVNELLGLVGIRGPAWLIDADWVKPSIVMLAVWQVGVSVIFLTAAIQGVPPELQEAARIDGANSRQIFRRITLPLITPVLLFVMVTGLIGAFRVFSQAYVLSQGTYGPDNASLMMVPYIYTSAFRNYELGYASALAWLLFLIIIALNGVIIKSSRRWVFYESDVNR